MYTIAILSQTGGTGKTTLALHLAVAAAKDRKSAVVADLDPPSQRVWMERYSYQEAPVVVPTPPNRLSQALEAAHKGRADFEFVDTAPHSSDDALGCCR